MNSDYKPTRFDRLVMAGVIVGIVLLWALKNGWLGR